jgi:hypothetical protein
MITALLHTSQVNEYHVSKVPQDLDCVCYSSTVNWNPSELIVGFTMVRASPAQTGKIFWQNQKFVEEFVEVITPWI